MAWKLPNPFRNLTYVRDKGGNHTYFNEGGNWSSNEKTNLYLAQNHPILTPAMLFRSKLFSQAEFKVVHKDTGKERKNHWLIELLTNPNYYQTKSDFLESLDFMQVAQGKSVLWAKKRLGYNSNKDIEAFYLLNSDLIEFPKGYNSEMLNRSQDSKIENVMITYDKDGANKKIAIKDLLFFYDLPNMLCQIGGKEGSNFFEVRSRLDGLKQTLINTQDSLVAKNIILKTNGKEMISGENGGFPLGDDEKKDAENLLQSSYGMGWFRNRSIVTKAKLDWKSMHIAARDLGLDESVKVDGNIIYTALHIPKDIISLEAKKTTYNNFKESMVSYVQNEMQSTLDAFIDVLQGLIDDTNLKLVGSYEHLPIMQFILIERYEGISKKAKALNDLLRTGVPQEVALEMTGFDKTLKLEEIQSIGNEGNNQNSGQQGGEQKSSSGDNQEEE